MLFLFIDGGYCGGAYPACYHKPCLIAVEQAIRWTELRTTKIQSSNARTTCMTLVTGAAGRPFTAAPGQVVHCRGPRPEFRDKKCAVAGTIARTHRSERLSPFAPGCPKKGSVTQHDRFSSSGNRGDFLYFTAKRQVPSSVRGHGNAPPTQ